MSGNAPPPRVLVVEDSALGREVVLGMLRRLAHGAESAADGAAALAAVDAEVFDLVLMDLELPDMDGFAATEAIRRRRPGVPVVAVTAHDDEEVRARCRDAGMAAHLAKPVGPERLAATIADVLGHTMDWSGALRALGGREALLRRVADAFREEAPRLLAAARDALDRGDAEELRRAAHTLHGAMRWFDAPAAQERARALEQAALTPDWDEARRLLPRLDAAVARILPAVARFLRDLETGMANVLVVDDSKVDRLLVEELLADGDTLVVETVASAREALARLASGEIDLVVTDLVMPDMDGLALTKEMRRRRPGIPVILMTAQGSEQVAVDALKAGAASYVPKDNLAQELKGTIGRVLDVVGRVRERELLKEAMRRSEASFVVPNDTKLIRIVVKHLQECTSLIGIGDEATNTQIGVALQEALINAALHGNLEIGSELRESDMAAYEKLISTRAGQRPYRDRAVHVDASLTRDEARFVIRDEGPGFDPSTLPDPRRADNLHKVSGRGVLLMRAFMDEVTYNHSGNEVTLVKRRA